MSKKNQTTQANNSVKSMAEMVELSNEDLQQVAGGITFDMNGGHFSGEYVSSNFALNNFIRDDEEDE
jgi:hypothetical protein